jgi:hypothetical protein
MPTYRRDGSLRGDATRADPSVIVVEPDAGDPYNGNGFRCATVRPEVPA